MEAEKVYPISEKKLLELRKKGLVPHSIVAARIFTFGVLLLSTNLFKAPFRRIMYMFTGAANDSTLDYVSVILLEALKALTTSSLTIFGSYLLFSLVETRFLVLPFSNYKEGIRKIKNPISIGSELILTLILGLPFLIWIVFSINSNNSSFLLSDTSEIANPLNTFGIFAIFLSLSVSLLNKLQFWLRNRMSKTEILKESLEGQMSPTNRGLIDKAKLEI